jgi:hypothetical protein
MTYGRYSRACMRNQSNSLEIAAQRAYAPVSQRLAALNARATPPTAPSGWRSGRTRRGRRVRLALRHPR